MKTSDLLKAFGFENSVEEPNLYYRKAEDGYDVIRHFEDEYLYNICLKDECFDFISETKLITILTK